jgi:hypothetical protein
MSTRAFVVVLSWLLSVAGGFGYLSLFAGAPGVAATAPRSWPADVTIPRDIDRPTLLVPLHVESASSRETVVELGRLMARVRDRVDAHVLLVPGGRGEDLMGSPLWRSATSIANVDVRVDDGGTIAARFGAVASERVLLYDTDGTLRFAGGIADTRAGRDALEATIRGAIGRGRADSFACAPRLERDDQRGIP